MFTDPWGLKAADPSNNVSAAYWGMVAMGPGAAAFLPGAAASGGAIGGGGYQGLNPPKPTNDGYQQLFGEQTSPPPSVGQQIGNAIGGFVNGAIDGAKNLGGLIFNQSDGGNDVTSRPSGFRKPTVQDNWDNAADGSAGGKLCPTCGKEVTVKPGEGPRDWDINHVPAWSQRDLKGLDRKGVLDEYNRGTELECPSCNRSRGAKPK